MFTSIQSEQVGHQGASNRTNLLCASSQASGVQACLKLERTICVALWVTASNIQVCTSQHTRQSVRG